MSTAEIREGSANMNMEKLYDIVSYNIGWRVRQAKAVLASTDNYDNRNTYSARTGFKHVVMYDTNGAIFAGFRVNNGFLEERLAACVNILPNITSKYWWEGAIQNDSESILMIKTRGDLAADLMKKVKEVHSYDVPEVISVNVKEGSPEYLDWVEKVTKPI